MTTMMEENGASPQRRLASQRVVALKWLVVLAALSIATVLDGLPKEKSFDPSRSIEQATVTLPAERCGPGCAIMVASNQTGDAFIQQAE
jgi:hypothetical protein